MKEIIKKIIRFYWHHSSAYSLVTLPINGLGALSSFLVLFTLISGVKFAGWIYWALFLASTFLLFGVGVVLRKMGIIAYWQSLSNQQNDMLREIYEKIVDKG